MILSYIGMFCLGCLVLYLILKPKLKSIEQLDQQTKTKNLQLKTEQSNLQKELAILETKKHESLNSIENLRQQAEAAANTFYNQAYELAENNFTNSTNLLEQQFQEEKAKAEKEYLTLLEEYSINAQEEFNQKTIELNQLSTKLAEMKSAVDAAVAANKQAIEIAEASNFYKLVLSDEDLQEISRLKEVSQYLRDTEPLNKVIWKVYYEKPYTDLIGRVVGTTVKTGIYKITNLQNNMCYVGQAVDIADRWRQHIKRGLGAEAPTKNKLYPAMRAIGVENFTFEIIETCSRDRLNEREDYWQDYFHAKDFGYSIK